MPEPKFSFGNLCALEEALRANSEDAAEICARYLLLHLHARHPSQWLSGPRKTSDAGVNLEGVLTALAALGVTVSTRQTERLKCVPGVPDLVRRFYFRGVVLDSHEGLAGWLDRRYPLILRNDLPTPGEMLDIQCEGRRFVTLLLAEEAQFRRYGRHADACAFLLHDFEHAHKFFGNSESFRGQVRFFQALRASLPAFSRWTQDEAFVRDLGYLKSDMNSHPVHLTKYLKAVVLSAEMRRSGLRHPPLDEFWREVFGAWGMKDGNLEAVLRINQPESETPADLVATAGFFMPPGIESSCGPFAMDAR